MVITGRCSSSAKDIGGEVQKRIPRCREFVAKFWGVEGNLAQPKKITVEEVSETGHSACILPENRELVLFASNFDIGGMDKLDRVLVHELTHLVTTSFMDTAYDETRCVAEGLASLATDAFFSEEREYSFEKTQYFRGKRFVRALYDGGVAPIQMHPLLSIRPTITELFIPSRYLDRMGIPYSFDDKVGTHDIMQWVELATCIGKLSLGEGITYSRENGKFVFGFSPGKKKDLENLSKPKGMPRNLLHNPGAYGLCFMKKLAHYLKGLERALAVIEKHPPAGLVGQPESIAHIIEPHRYVIKVQMQDSSLRRL